MYCLTMNYYSMKSYFISLIFICFLTVGYGQKHGDFQKAQFKEVVETLQLSSSKASELEPVYAQFMRELRPEKHHRFNPMEPMTEERIEEMTRAKLAMAKHIATVREKYYDIFRKILSPSQIEKMYQAEREIMRRVKQESKLRKKNE